MSADSSSSDEGKELPPSISTCQSLESLLTVLEEAFAYPKTGLRYERDRVIVSEQIAEAVARSGLFDIDALIDFLVEKRSNSKNTGLFGSLFSSGIVKEDQELVRATSVIALGELAKVLDENTLLIKLRVYFWEPLLATIRGEDSPEGLMGAMRAIGQISLKLQNARNVAVDPSIASLRDDMIVALLGLVAFATDEPSSSSRYSVSTVLGSVAGLLNIKRLYLSAGVFSKVLDVCLKLTSDPSPKPRRIASVCQVLRVLTSCHAQSWPGVSRILHALAAAGGQADAFLAVCSCAPSLFPKEQADTPPFSDYSDSLALAFAQGAGRGAPAVRKLLNAGNFPSFADAVVTLPADVVGALCESLIARDCECELVLTLLRERAKDLPDYFSAKIISLIFSKNKRYFDCIQYIAEAHLPTTLRKILESSCRKDEISSFTLEEGLQCLVVDNVTVVRALGVLADFVANSDSNHHGYVRMVSGLLFFLRLKKTNEWVSKEISSKFHDFFTLLTICFLAAPDLFTEGLLEISPSPEFSEKLSYYFQQNRRCPEETVAGLAASFPQYVKISLAEKFLARETQNCDQKVCAAALLCGTSLSGMEKDTDFRVRKFAARSLRGSEELVRWCLVESNPVVIEELLKNGFMNHAPLSLRLSDLSIVLENILGGLAFESQSLLNSALQLIPLLDFSEKDISPRFFTFLLMHVGAGSIGASKAIDTLVRVCGKEIVGILEALEQNVYENTIDRLLNADLFNKKHLAVCKELASSTKVDSLSSSLVASLSTLLAKLARSLEPVMAPNELKKIVSLLIGFASLAEFEQNSRGQVILAMRHLVHITSSESSNT